MIHSFVLASDFHQHIIIQTSNKKKKEPAKNLYVAVPPTSFGLKVTVQKQSMGTISRLNMSSFLENYDAFDGEKNVSTHK